MENGVSRPARRFFTYAVVSGGTSIGVLLALRGIDTKVAQILVEGMMTLVMTTSCAYIGASAVDYSFGDRASRMISGVRGVTTSTERTVERNSTTVATPSVEDAQKPSSRAD